VATPAKVAVVDRVSEQMSVAAATLLTDYRGLTVTELAELRVELRKANATYEVVKNTLTRLAAKKAGMDGLDEMLVGPTAIVFCADDPVGPAKALKAFAKTHEELVVKGGYLDGAALTAAEAMQLAELASREELLATMAGLMQGTLSGFARLMNAPLAGMARAMGALEGDGGVEAKGFAPVGAPVAAPVEEAPVEEAPVEEAPAETVTEDAPEATADDAPEAVAEAAPAAAASEDDASAADADADA
jgi:large subunit ribosomal protein L10